MSQWYFIAIRRPQTLPILTAFIGSGISADEWDGKRVKAVGLVIGDEYLAFTDFAKE